MLRALAGFFSAILSFALSILIALFVLFAGGYVFRVLLGGETSSQYLQRYVDFYRNPQETPLGQWARQARDRVRR